jgi:purine-binding chemotaxis protein CheW
MEDHAVDVLVFELDGHRCGLPLGEVREVLRAARLLPLPSAPAVVEGVIDLRGEIMPVLDVRARFGLSRRPLDVSDHLVVARARERAVVLRVDRALELRQIPVEDVTDVRDVTPAAAHVAGVARLPDGLIVIHDLHAFLTEAESARLDAAMAARNKEGA